MRLLALAVAAFVLPSTEGVASDFRIRDPYADGRGDWYRGQLHMHSVTHEQAYAVQPARDPHVPGIHFISGVEVGFRLTRIRAYVDAGRTANERWDSPPSWRTPSSAGSAPLTFFAEPGEQEPESFYRLRELRLSAGARSAERIREDAVRLGFSGGGSARE